MTAAAKPIAVKPKAAQQPLPQPKRDWVPLLIVPVLALVAVPLTGNFSAWLTLP